MRIKFDFTKPLAQIRRLVDNCIKALNDAEKRHPIRQTLADRLEQMILADFDRKASGGTGAGGITWKPDAKATVQQKRKHGHSGKIGVDTGALRSSLQVRQSNTQASGDADVIAMFTASYAGYFDADRTLLPEQFPDQWTTALEEGVQPWAERVMQAEIDKI